MLLTQRQLDLDESTILGRPGEDLRLRVLGPNGDARAVRVKTRKCTIGSADNCSLQLRGDGVQPVHCLLVRGRRTTVVRSMSENSRLNGRPFTDAEVVPGDRLRIGDFEIELLTNRARRPATPAAASAEHSATLHLTAAIETRINRLEDQLILIQRQQTRTKIRKLRRTINRLSRQISEQQLQHAGERLQWASEREELLANLEQAPARRDEDSPANSDDISEHPALVMAEDLSRLSAELDEANHRHQHREDEWIREKAELEAELAITREQILRLENELGEFQSSTGDLSAERTSYEAGTSELAESLEKLRNKLAQQQSAHLAEKEAWETARGEIEKQLEATRAKLHETAERLSAAEQQLADEQAAHAETVSQQERERTDLQAAHDALAMQLAESEEAARNSREQVAQWEQECHSLAARVEELQQQIEALRQSTLEPSTLSDSEEEVASLQAEIGTLRQAQSEQQADWESERQRLLTALEASQRESAQHQQVRGELEREAAVESANWEKERRELQTALQEAPTSRRVEELESQLAGVQQELDYWQRRSEEGEPTEPAPPDTPADPITGHEPGPNDPPSAPGEEDAEPTTTESSAEIPPSREAPVSTADILARMGHTGLSAEEPESESAPPSGAESAPAPTDPTPAVSALAVSTPATGSEPGAFGGPAANDSDDGEEGAIEDYMNRLLERVRGEKGPTTMPAPARPVDRAPITEAPLPPQPAAEPEQSGEYVPRRVAPERSDSLAAMRSLANDSTRSAIARHAVRNWMEVAKYQICGAATGVTASVVAFVTLAESPVLAIVGVAAGLTVAAAFGSQALAVRKDMLAHPASFRDEVREEIAETAPLEEVDTELTES